MAQVMWGFEFSGKEALERILKIGEMTEEDQLREWLAGLTHKDMAEIYTAAMKAEQTCAGLKAVILGTMHRSGFTIKEFHDLSK